MLSGLFKSGRKKKKRMKLKKKKIHRTYKEAVHTKDSAGHTSQAGVGICFVFADIWNSNFIVTFAGAVVGSDHAGAALTLRNAGIGLARVILSKTVHITGRICTGFVRERRAVPVSLRFYDCYVTCDYHQLQS